MAEDAPEQLASTLADFLYASAKTRKFVISGMSVNALGTGRRGTVPSGDGRVAGGVRASGMLTTDQALASIIEPRYEAVVDAIARDYVCSATRKGLHHRSAQRSGTFLGSGRPKASSSRSWDLLRRGRDGLGPTTHKHIHGAQPRPCRRLVRRRPAHRAVVGARAPRILRSSGADGTALGAWPQVSGERQKGADRPGDHLSASSSRERRGRRRVFAVRWLYDAVAGSRTA